MFDGKLMRVMNEKEECRREISKLKEAILEKERKMQGIKAKE